MRDKPQIFKMAPLCQVKFHYIASTNPFLKVQMYTILSQFNKQIFEFTLVHNRKYMTQMQFHVRFQHYTNTCPDNSFCMPSIRELYHITGLQGRKNIWYRSAFFLGTTTYTSQMHLKTC